MCIKSPVGTLESPKMPYIWSKLHCTCGDHPAGAFWTKSSHVGPSDDLFRDQKARFRTYWGLKRALFAHIMAFFDPKGDSEVLEMGQ